MSKNGDFYALLLKMKNINRWGLMYNTRNENLCEHSMACAIISHALSIIGNELYNKNYDAQKILAAALFHDMNEVLTGDLPTPVKYFNDEIKNAYKKIEQISGQKMLSLLDENSAKYYNFIVELKDEEKTIIKAADKLCAYIKCLEELSRGNNEFRSASVAIKKALDEFDSVELKYFMENYLDSFVKNIDEVSL